MVWMEEVRLVKGLENLNSGQIDAQRWSKELVASRATRVSKWSGVYREHPVAEWTWLEMRAVITAMMYRSLSIGDCVGVYAVG